MKWLKKSLEVLTVVSFGAAVLGTVGACDLGTIGLGQALLQIGICTGAGVILLAGRWLLCRHLTKIARIESLDATQSAPATRHGIHTTNKKKAG